MGIICDYDTMMVMDGCKREVIGEIMRHRKYAMVEVDSAEIKKRKESYRRDLWRLDSFYRLGIREKGEDISFGECRYYLNLARSRIGEKDDVFAARMREIVKIPGVKVTYPDREELLSFADGKELVYQVHFAEKNGNVESRIMKRLRKNIFLMTYEDSGQLYDDFYDVKIYLQKCRKEDRQIKRMEPADVRKLDVNRRILEFLEKNSRKFFRKKSNDLFVEFEAVSDKIQAQYFLTHICSNTEWEYDSPCIFCFRIAAFILPGTADEGETVTEDSITIDGDSGEKYRIDSIHFNSDILEDINEFEELMRWHFFEITVA